MTVVQQRVRLWAYDPYFDEATRFELQNIAEDQRELQDRFYKELEFGTGGLRGLIAAGTNRINRYSVRHATQGLARYIAAQGADAKARGVVIAHDSRRFSPEFALEAALTLAANGIVAYLWDSLRPTPMLSFAVRELGATAGIVITASHNPPEYNGYKVYWSDGGQVPPERASAIQAEIRAITDLTSIHPMAEAAARAAGLVRAVPSEVDRNYTDRLKSLVLDPDLDRSACTILYTPLHGAGNVPVRQVLSELGYRVHVVTEQAEPDGNFPTVRYPNPEEREVFDLAARQAETLRPDVIMATDPDADRLGVLALDGQGRYRLLSGNQIGAVLVDYLLNRRAEHGSLPANGAVIKTIATSNMIAPLCKEYGVALLDTHTGFKFIGDKIREFEETGEHTFLFGFEESYGYLGATFVRDKDAVMSALLVAEAAAYYKTQGQTLYDALERIWQRCGCFAEGLHNVTLPGQKGQARSAELMADMRRVLPRDFAGIPVSVVDDYSTGLGLDLSTGESHPLALAKANVLHYRFADGGFVMIRPSGTEPKLKIYVSVVDTTPEAAEARVGQVTDAVLRRMNLTA